MSTRRNITTRAQADDIFRAWADLALRRNIDGEKASTIVCERFSLTPNQFRAAFRKAMR